MARNAGGDAGSNLFQVQHLFVTLELVQDFMQHLLDVARRNSGCRGLDGDGARAERFHFKAVAVQFVADLREDRHLARSQLDDERHQQLLLFGRLGQAQLADFFEQNAFVRDVLVNDPQALWIDREDERVANLAHGTKRAQRIQFGRCVVVRKDGRAAIFAPYHGGSARYRTAKRLRREAGHGNRRISFDGKAAALELQPRTERRDLGRTQSKRSIGSGHLQLVSRKIAGSRRERRRSCGLGVNLRYEGGHWPGFHQDGANGIANEVVQHRGLPKAHLGLGGMHVDVNLGEGHLQEQQHDRENRRRNDVAVSLGEGVLHHAIANQAAIDEDENRVAVKLLDLRPRNKAVKFYVSGNRRFVVFFVAPPRRRLRQSHARQRQQRAQRNQLIERLLAKHLVDTLRVAGHGRGDQHGVGRGVQLPVHLGMGQGVVRYQRCDVRQFGGFSLQEFSARGNVEEQIADRDARAQRQARLLDGQQLAAGDLDHRSGSVFGRMGLQTQAAYGSHGRQRLSTKSQGCNVQQVVGIADLGGGVTLESQHGIVAHHPAAVVGHLDQFLATCFDGDPDAARTGIQRVFQQLLDHRSGALHDFAGGDLVGYVFGENVDAAHDFKSNSPQRHRESISVSSFEFRRKLASSAIAGTYWVHYSINSPQRHRDTEKQRKFLSLKFQGSTKIAKLKKGAKRRTSPNVSQGGGEWRKAARSAGGARSISGNHGAGLLRRSFLATSAGVYRFFVRARHTTPSTQRFAQIRLATASLSAAQSCNLQLPVHPAEQLEMRIAGRQRHPDLAYGDANLGPNLEQL